MTMWSKHEQLVGLPFLIRKCEVSTRRCHEDWSLRRFSQTLQAMKSNGTQVIIEACDVAVESVSSEADLKLCIESNMPIESCCRSVAKCPLLFRKMPSRYSFRGGHCAIFQEHPNSAMAEESGYGWWTKSCASIGELSPNYQLVGQILSINSIDGEKSLFFSPFSHYFRRETLGFR